MAFFGSREENRKIFHYALFFSHPMQIATDAAKKAVVMAGVFLRSALHHKVEVTGRNEQKAFNGRVAKTKKEKAL